MSLLSEESLNPSEESLNPRKNGPPGWFPDDGPPEVDWDHVKTLRTHRIATIPAVSLSASGFDTKTFWPCMICKDSFASAHEVHDHVPTAHPKIHSFFLGAHVFFTRCVVCCEFISYFLSVFSH